MARPRAGKRSASPETRLTPRGIPLDDEPLSAEDIEAIAEADADYAAGDYMTLEELKAALDVPAHTGRRPRKSASSSRIRSDAALTVREDDVASHSPRVGKKGA